MRNIIRRATLLAGDKEITMTALPQEIIHFQKFSFNDSDKNDNSNSQTGAESKSHVEMGPVTLKDAAAQAEADVLKKILEEVKYNRTKAAQKLGIDRKTLFNKMKQHNL
jgi:two-component system response regulator HydG